MTDFGFDVKTYPDLSPRLEKIGGRSVLIESLYRRLSTPRGSLWWDDEYGLDLRGLLGAGIKINRLSDRALRRVEVEIVNQLSKDERILRSVARVRYEALTRAFTVYVDAVDSSGPFRLVFRLDSTNILTVIEGANG